MVSTLAAHSYATGLVRLHGWIGSHATITLRTASLKPSLICTPGLGFKSMFAILPRFSAACTKSTCDWVSGSEGTPISSRIAWVKSHSGYFLVADNTRGRHLALSQHAQCLVTILAGLSIESYRLDGVAWGRAIFNGENEPA